MACTVSAAPGSAAGSRRSPTTYIEGFGELREASADLPQADDKECLAAEFVFTLGEIADHAAPEALCLVIARPGKPTAQREDEGHRVLRSGAVADTARAGEANGALCQFFERKLISAGADRLDKAEFLRALKKAVMPQPRDHEHVGLADPILQGPGIANGEAIDTAVEGRKPLMQPIGDVGEADRKLFIGGSMAALRLMTSKTAN
jgi:hypothetical protein